MNFTPQETKLIERLRKQDRHWRWARWFLLMMGVFFTGLCAAFGYFLHGLIAQSTDGLFDGNAVFLILLIWTKCCIYFFFGGWCFITACLKWNGDVNRMLLLRLLDAQQRVV